MAFGLGAAGQDLPVRRDRGAAAGVAGVRVCHWMIPLVPVRADHDPVKHVHTRHAPTIAAAVAGFRSKTGLRLRSASADESQSALLATHSGGRLDR
jgi:hypothetical protein